MTSQWQDRAIPDSAFPDSDGNPMADNTEQYRWIVVLKENLEALFTDRPDVFVAADLLWYPVSSRIIPPIAPDVMVVFGRPKGRRGSYRQWQEDNLPPQVVFEILSPSNTAEEMDRKLEFYNAYGVEEYYLYNPDTFELSGWLRQTDHLTRLWQLNGWLSPRLKIRFDTAQGEPVFYRPDGQRFLTLIEMEQRATQAEQQLEQTEQQLEQTKDQLEQERQRVARLTEYLRSQGIDPDRLSN
ncbi:Uma2 family endonuclease [Leptolyngbya sp. FACHB-36]|uniref:Uma2 family endonuclease n=1 Tax=Leptolyngbya sp. FACHB-36 TaxID=2692808 RepID=UPI001681733E|nr:Uma2 family endonuclease [Leptolyngbya sp. FACHB-36]MBD2021187.1 Uma2 family endonuclease [Leptolyngbya sp. FACHB-36]